MTEVELCSRSSSAYSETKRMDSSGPAQSTSLTSHFRSFGADLGLFLRGDLVLHPEGGFLALWEWLMLLAALYQLLSTPWFAALDPEAGWALMPLDLLLLSLHAVDFLVCCRIGFYEHGGALVFDSSTVMWRYLRSRAAVLDLIALAPLEFLAFVLPSAPGGDVRFTRPFWFAILKMKHLLRLHTLWSSARVERGFQTPRMRVLKIFLAWALLAHILAALFIFVGHNQPNGETYNWMEASHVQHEGQGGMYVTSLYWVLVIMTTTGYGDLHSVTPYEQGVSIAVLLLSLGFYAAIFSSIAASIMAFQVQARKFQQLMDSSKEYAAVNDLPTDLKVKMNRYATYDWQQNHGFAPEKFLADLPSSVQSEILLYIHSSLVQRVPFFRCCSDRFIEAAILRMHPQVVLAGDFLFREGDKSREMYFLKDGEVEVLMDDVVSGGEQRPIATLAAFSEAPFFGEVAILLGTTRTASVRALVNSVLVCLRAQDFWELLEAFPDEEVSLREEAVRRLQADLARIKEAHTKKRGGGGGGPTTGTLKPHASASGGGASTTNKAGEAGPAVIPPRPAPSPTNNRRENVTAVGAAQMVITARIVQLQTASLGQYGLDTVGGQHDEGAGGLERAQTQTQTMTRTQTHHQTYDSMLDGNEGVAPEWAVAVHNVASSSSSSSGAAAAPTTMAVPPTHGRPRSHSQIALAALAAAGGAVRTGSGLRGNSITGRSGSITGAGAAAAITSSSSAMAAPSAQTAPLLPSSHLSSSSSSSSDSDSDDLEGLARARMQVRVSARASARDTALAQAAAHMGLKGQASARGSIARGGPGGSGLSPQPSQHQLQQPSQQSSLRRLSAQPSLQRLSPQPSQHALLVGSMSNLRGSHNNNSAHHLSPTNAMTMAGGGGGSIGGVEGLLGVDGVDVDARTRASARGIAKLRGRRRSIRTSAEGSAMSAAASPSAAATGGGPSPTSLIIDPAVASPAFPFFIPGSPAHLLAKLGGSSSGTLGANAVPSPLLVPGERVFLPGSTGSSGSSRNNSMPPSPSNFAAAGGGAGGAATGPLGSPTSGGGGGGGQHSPLPFSSTPTNRRFLSPDFHFGSSGFLLQGQGQGQAQAQGQSSPQDYPAGASPPGPNRRSLALPLPIVRQTAQRNLLELPSPSAGGGGSGGGGGGGGGGGTGSGFFGSSSSARSSLLRLGAFSELEGVGAGVSNMAPGSWASQTPFPAGSTSALGLPASARVSQPPSARAGSFGAANSAGGGVPADNRSGSNGTLLAGSNANSTAPSPTHKSRRSNEGRLSGGGAGAGGSRMSEGMKSELLARLATNSTRALLADTVARAAVAAAAAAATTAGDDSLPHTGRPGAMATADVNAGNKSFRALLAAGANSPRGDHTSGANTPLPPQSKPVLSAQNSFQGKSTLSPGAQVPGRGISPPPTSGGGGGDGSLSHRQRATLRAEQEEQLNTLARLRQRRDGARASGGPTGSARNSGGALTGAGVGNGGSNRGSNGMGGPNMRGSNAAGAGTAGAAGSGAAGRSSGGSGGAGRGGGGGSSGSGGNNSFMDAVRGALKSVPAAAQEQVYPPPPARRLTTQSSNANANATTAGNQNASRGQQQQQQQQQQQIQMVQMQQQHQQHPTLVLPPPLMMGAPVQPHSSRDVIPTWLAHAVGVVSNGGGAGSSSSSGANSTSPSAGASRAVSPPRSSPPPSRLSFSTPGGGGGGVGPAGATSSAASSSSSSAASTSTPQQHHRVNPFSAAAGNIISPAANGSATIGSPSTRSMAGSSSVARARSPPALPHMQQLPPQQQQQAMSHTLPLQPQQQHHTPLQQTRGRPSIHGAGPRVHPMASPPSNADAAYAAIASPPRTPNSQSTGLGLGPTSSASSSAFPSRPLNPSPSPPSGGVQKPARIRTSVIKTTINSSSEQSSDDQY